MLVRLLLPIGYWLLAFNEFKVIQRQITSRLKHFGVLLYHNIDNIISIFIDR